MILPVSTVDVVKKTNQKMSVGRSSAILSKSGVDAFARQSQISFGDGGKEPKPYN